VRSTFLKTIKSDLVITGAGPAGISAALAAARHGVKVALVHNMPVPGGNGSSEIGVKIFGASNGESRKAVSVYGRETGIVEEIKLKILEFNQDNIPIDFYENWAMLDAAYFELLYGEENIDLYLNTSVYDAVVENGSVKCILAHQINSEQELCFTAPLFVDASGDGTVAFKSGARFMWGRESSEQFGESHAPLKPVKNVMGSSLFLFSKYTDSPKKYKKPGFAYDVTKQPFWKNIKPEFDREIERYTNFFQGFWWLEIGGLHDVISESEDITKELRKIVYGMWDYIKNSGKFKDTENLQLDRVSIVAGKRESRRFIGDYVLTQTDIDNKTDFFDAIGYGGWAMDCHSPNGIYDHDHAAVWHFVPGIYNFPYRTLYSKDLDNLFICGRIHSASHLAMGSTRIMATCAVGGQAAGTAAYLCKKHKALPRDITKKYIKELQKTLIRDDQSIVGFADDDGVSLFKNAKIQVSSVKKYENILCPQICPMDNDFCLALPYDGRLDSVDVKVKNAKDKTVSLVIEIYGGKRPENYIPEELLKTISVDIAPGFDGFITVPIGTSPLGDKKLYLNFKKSPHLSLYTNKRRYTGMVTFTSILNSKIKEYPNSGLIALTRSDENLCFKNITPYISLFDSKNLINGYTRPYGFPNLWISDDLPGQPQTISVKFNEPKELGNFIIIFDTCLEKDNIPNKDIRFIKKYTIKADGLTGKIFSDTVDDCYKRRSIHHINMKDVTAISIKLEETWGADYFSVFNIIVERLN
jgi:hypothetical protein